MFDGFCGTGMTGVAAQMCGNREVVVSLGYQVKPDGTILQEEMDEDGKKIWKPFSKIGARRVVQNDLSPSATSISKMYNSSFDRNFVKKEGRRVIDELKSKLPGYTKRMTLKLAKSVKSHQLYGLMCTIALIAMARLFLGCCC